MMAGTDTSHARVLRAIRAAAPLVHCVTNDVTASRVADALAAIGALPVMATAPQDVQEITRAANALFLNCGTPSQDRWDAMRAASAVAAQQGIPVVLDPVGAGATRLRTATARRILDEAEIAVVRGNAAEVATLAGRDAEIRGVESIGAAGSGSELAEAAASALG